MQDTHQHQPSAAHVGTNSGAGGDAPRPAAPRRPQHPRRAAQRARRPAAAAWLALLVLLSAAHASHAVPSPGSVVTPQIVGGQDATQQRCGRSSCCMFRGWMGAQIEGGGILSGGRGWGGGGAPSFQVSNAAAEPVHRRLLPRTHPFFLPRQVCAPGRDPRRRRPLRRVPPEPRRRADRGPLQGQGRGQDFAVDRWVGGRRGVCVWGVGG
jgi:hypothetical protein